MKVLQILSPGNIQIQDIEKPVPAYGEVVCKVIRAGICGTDYAINSGDFSAVKSGLVKFPLRPGHEWSGIVDEIGPGVDNLKKGDRVVGDTVVSCGQCYSCLIGQYQNCADLRAVGTVNAWDGAMAEYVLFPARHLIKLPNTVNFNNGALTEPAATGLYAVHHAPVFPGSTVAILGSGAIGLAVVSLCKVYGASKIIAVGRSDFKLDLCKQMGATHVINTREDDLIEKTLSFTNGEDVDVSIELSGSVELFKACGQITKRGGVISIIAFYDKETNFNIDNIVFRNHTYKPVPGGFGMFMPVLKLMQSGQIDLEPMITSHCSLSNAPEEISNLKTDNAKKIKVMVDFANKNGEL